jgi:putative tricarboxylic transport membrane protein
MGNIVGGAVVLLVCLVFWVQRDYTSEYGGLFPDALLVVLAVLSLFLIGRGVLWRHESGWESEGRLQPRDLARAVVLLVAWVASLPILGYLVGGIVFFTLVAVLMRTRRPRVKDIALDLVVGVGVVGAFYLAFTRFLYVNLPGLPF